MQNKQIKDSYIKANYVNNFIEKKALNSVLRACKYDLNKTTVTNAFIRMNLLKKSSYKTYNKNRCIITGRSRYILHKYGLSRLTFKDYTFNNKLPGLKRSSCLKKYATVTELKQIRSTDIFNDYFLVKSNLNDRKIAIITIDDAIKMNIGGALILLTDKYIIFIGPSGLIKKTNNFFNIQFKDKNLILNTTNYNNLYKHLTKSIQYDKKNITLLPLQYTNNNYVQKEGLNIYLKELNKNIQGVINNYSINLKLNGIGFKYIIKDNKNLLLRLGYSHYINYIIPNNIYIQTINETELMLISNDYNLLHKTASNIRNFKKPDFYKGNGTLHNNSIINLNYTTKSLHILLQFIEDLISNNGKILFIGTNNPNLNTLIKQLAENYNQYFTENTRNLDLVNTFKTMPNAIFCFNNNVSLVNNNIPVINNSGAKDVMCFKVLKSKYNNQPAILGDYIKVSIQNLKKKNETNLKKGEIYNAIVLTTKTNKPRFNGQKIEFFENSVILLDNDLNPKGSRIYGTITKELRKTNIKILLLASNII
ncbi:hypothetical protein WA158_002595 [Blastocystis sp. Blastoise]